MRHWKRGAALVLSLLLLAGCAAPAEEADSRWDPALKNTLGLTPEQRLEDYDHLVKTLKDSYLCLGVHDRENPEDPAEDIFRKYREMVAENDSDDAFYSAVYSTLWRLGSYGHLWIIEPEDYYEMLDWCKTQDTTGREQWKAVTEASEEQYAKLKAYLDGLGEEDGGSWSGGGETGENLHTLLLPEEGVAYLKVDSFLTDYDPEYPKEAQAILDFYNAAGGCTDLIIDLTDNSGGSERYWQNLLAAPLADAPLSCTNYALHRERLRPLGAPSHFGAAGPAQAGARGPGGRHPLCGEHAAGDPGGGAGGLPGPGVAAGGAHGLLRQRVLRRLLPGHRLRYPGGKPDQRGRHRGPGPHPHAAAQQRHFDPVHHDVRPEPRRLRQRGDGDRAGHSLPRRGARPGDGAPGGGGGPGGMRASGAGAPPAPGPGAA